MNTLEHASVHGDGPAVVFLHSFPLDRAMWSGQVATVTGCGRRAVLVDLPGFGAAPLPEDAGAPSLDGYVRAVLATLDVLAIERAAFVGLSLGGYVALRLAATAPERATGFVLADTRATADSPEAKAGRIVNLALVRDKGVGALVEKMIPLLLAPESVPNVAPVMRAMGARQSREGISFALVAMRDRPDQTATLAGVRVPALVMAGARDKITPPEEHRAMAAKLARGRYVEVPDAGHLSNLENPDAFNAALGEFLGEV
jgi:pimeloyl-ACP methyl ester carboxylesterase